MTQLPLSNIPMGAGMMYQAAPWGTRIFLNPQRGDVQAISKLLSLVLDI
jgi:hypothetical protein